MSVLNIDRLSDRRHCLHYIDKMRSLQKSGAFPLLADRYWILSAIMPEKPARVLDIGSSIMVFNHLLDRSITSQYDYHTLGNIPIDNRPQWMKESIHDCNIPGYPLPDGHFDLITCCDVIEHVQNQEVLLSECARMLKDDGVLFLTTPNYACAPCLLKLMRGRMFHDPCGNDFHRYCFNEHVRYYTPINLIPYLEKLGWHTSHIIMSGLVTELPGKSFAVRMFVNLIYNRLCMIHYRFVHQVMLVLCKQPATCRIVRCPQFPC